MKRVTQPYAEAIGASLSFHLFGVGRGVRPAGSDTGWRRLPASLFEMPEEGRWELDLEGQRCPFLVNPGEVIAVPAETLHRIRGPTDHASTSSFLLAQYLWLSGLDVVDRARVPFVLPATAGARIAPAVTEMLRLFAGARGRVEVVASIQELGFRVLRVAMEYAAVRDFAVPAPGLARIEPALARIRQTPGKHVSCAELAALVNLSPARFHAVFKAAVGVAPKVYMRSLQLRRACELLIQSDLPVYAVAEECGFGSAFYLCRQFRRHLGQTPRAFRTALAGPQPTDHQGHDLEPEPRRHRVHRPPVRRVHAPHHAGQRLARITVQPPTTHPPPPS